MKQIGYVERLITRKNGAIDAVILITDKKRAKRIGIKTKRIRVAVRS
jgi:hypothetical protein